MFGRKKSTFDDEFGTVDEQLAQLEKLTVQHDVPYLVAANRWLGKVCAKPNAAFIACKDRSGDPADCIAQGNAVVECSSQLLRDIDGSCATIFSEYRSCLIKNENKFSRCRKEAKRTRNLEKEFHSCVVQNVHPEFEKDFFPEGVDGPLGAMPQYPAPAK